MRRVRAFIIALTLVFVPASALAHPGGTDAYGCHVCRTKCSAWGLSTGEYHCHQNKGLTQPKAPVTSTKAATKKGTGVTRLAPKYAKPKR